jgi:hypothetical protein
MYALRQSLTFRLASHRTLSPKLANALITTHGRTLRRLNLFRLAISAYSAADILRHVSNLEQFSLELGGVLDDLVRHRLELFVFAPTRFFSVVISLQIARPTILLFLRIIGVNFFSLSVGCDATCCVMYAVQDLIIEALPAAQHLHTLIDTSPTVSTTTSRSSRRQATNTQTKPSQPKFRALTRAQATQLLEAGPVLANVVSQQRNWAVSLPCAQVECVGKP